MWIVCGYGGARAGPSGGFRSSTVFDPGIPGSVHEPELSRDGTRLVFTQLTQNIGDLYMLTVSQLAVSNASAT